MRWWVALLVVALWALAGCGGGSEPAAKPTPTPSATSAAEPTTTVTPTPAVAEPAGEPAPEALSEFRCEPAKKNTWEATGLLANTGKKAATYQVSVYVGPIDGTSRKLRTQQVAGIAPDGSARFEITSIPADGDECHVQVLRTR